MTKTIRQVHIDSLTEDSANLQELVEVLKTVELRSAQGAGLLICLRRVIRRVGRSCKSMGVSEQAALAGAGAEFLDKLCANQIPLSPAALDVLDKLTDAFRQFLIAREYTGQTAAPDYGPVLEALASAQRAAPSI